MSLLFAVVLWTVAAAFGGCPAIGVSKTRIKTTTNKEFQIRFSIKNDGLKSFTNYFVSLGIPREAIYLRSTVKIAKANAPQITPTVMDGVVVWRFPKLPSRARVKFSASFKVDQYCVPESMLAFDISGYQIVNTTIECSTAVSQGVRISCFVQGCLTGVVYVSAKTHSSHNQTRIDNSAYCVPLEEAPSNLGFVGYASGGMDCVEQGTIAPLSFPTTYDCYQYCSTSGLPTRWYFRMRTLTYGATECSCLGTACHIAPALVTGRRLHYIRDLQTNGSIVDTTIYEALQSAPPTAQPTSSPSVQPTSQPTAQPTLQQSANSSRTVLPTIEQGPNTPILNVRQLSLGYHSFLGLLPHEQQGVYMRRPSTYVFRKIYMDKSCPSLYGLHTHADGAITKHSPHI